MNIYTFTDIVSNRVSVVNANSLDDAWDKYITVRLPVASAEESLSDIRKDLEQETLVNSNVEYIM